MTEEIKEILDKLEKVANRETASRNALMEMKDTDYRDLLDYITNLQQENERLKEDNLLIKSANKLVSDNLHNYKSRCEKAIKYIKSTVFYGMRSGKTLLQKYLYKLIDILNGSDEK